MSTGWRGERLPPGTWLALLNEAVAARTLLGHSVQILRRDRDHSTERDPLFACLASGLEKTTRLTRGLQSVKESGQWLSERQMRGYGHGIARLDAECREYMCDHVDEAVAKGYMRDLLDEVATDETMEEVLQAVTEYATAGRFHYQDRLGEAPQDRRAPGQLWDALETRLFKQLYAGAATGYDPDAWKPTRQATQEAIEKSLMGWWNLYHRAWVQGIYGARARQWSGEIRPLEG